MGSSAGRLLPLLLQTEPDLGLPAYADELVTLFGLAAQAPGQGPG